MNVTAYAEAIKTALVAGNNAEARRLRTEAFRMWIEGEAAELYFEGNHLSARDVRDVFVLDNLGIPEETI